MEEVKKDLERFLQAHRDRAKSMRFDEDGIYGIVEKQTEIIKQLTEVLAVKQREIADAKHLITTLETEMRNQAQELRVTKDLLSIAKAIDDGK